MGKAGREAGSLERECARLRQGGGGAGAKAGADGGSDSSGENGSGGSGAPTIMDYIQLKSSVGEAQKAVADWRRKLEVAAGAAGARRA